MLFLQLCVLFSVLFAYCPPQVTETETISAIITFGTATITTTDFFTYTASETYFSTLTDCTQTDISTTTTTSTVTETITVTP